MSEIHKAEGFLCRGLNIDEYQKNRLNASFYTAVMLFKKDIFR